ISFSPAFDSGYIDRLKELNDIDDKGKKIKNQDKPRTEVVVWDLDEGLLARAGASDQPVIRALYAAGSEQKRKLQQKLAARRPTVGQPASNQAELDAENDRLEARRLGMTATGTALGNIWLRAKSDVTIQGVNKRFGGDWYVSSVTHKIDSGGYKT